jgi:two-component system, response regulator PdtaR
VTPGSAKVLIVEDEPLAAEHTRSQLRRLGYAVAGIAATAREAVALTAALRPDVVLMDVQLVHAESGRDDPGGGFAATRAILADVPTPVVLLTAYQSPGLLAEATAAGVGAYLVKPAPDQDLDRAIAIAVARFADMQALKRVNEELQQALAEVQTLKGLIPICGWCKRIRDDRGYWEAVESFISARTEATFTHGVCPECAEKVREETSQLLRRREGPGGAADGPPRP